MQSLFMVCNLILVGVPMDTCANTLQKVLVEKMEEARQNMVKCNTQKYGLINKVPQFVLKQDFLKNTPCDKRSEEDDIPF